jgi:hypothetical protein
MSIKNYRREKATKNISNIALFPWKKYFKESYFFSFMILNTTKRVI